MPIMRKPDIVLALTVSDIHWEESPPLFRSKESDWYEAMYRPWKQIKALQEQHSQATPWKIPILAAGDLFNKPHPKPALINWVIANIPQIHAVPGQHDLPHHRYEDVKRSAYWTLVEAGTVVHLEYNQPFIVGETRLWGFPWGSELHPFQGKGSLALDIAVIHHYVWKRGCSYEGASYEDRVKRIQKKLNGFDVCVFGDNHLGFQWNNLLNCGTLLRRRRDEFNYQPCVGLIYGDGRIERVPLDCSEDVYLQEDVLQEIEKIGFGEFLEELADLGEAGANYPEAITIVMDRKGIRKEVRNIVLQAMGIEP